MQNLRVAICDDDEVFREQIKDIALTIKPDIVCDEFDSGEELISEFDTNKYDLLLLDIFMDGMNGVETLEKIRTKDNQICAAFITTSSDFAMDGYRLHVARYIEKPVNKSQVDELLNFVCFQKSAKPHIEIANRGRTIKILVNELIYAEQKGHSVIFHIKGGKIEKATGKLDTIEEELEGHHFFRCHKSYLVNLEYVTAIDTDLRVFHMCDDENAYIRRDDVSKARHAYEDYIFTKTRSM
ncbi:MAG: LytTR family DNA-binding domain-containing protein [Lachnospiraceae bacterium]|nr:LytTR family DNA-binding domain-containing protein [Lachnospiraceae bacterium]